MEEGKTGRIKKQQKRRGLLFARKAFVSMQWFRQIYVYVRYPINVSIANWWSLCILMHITTENYTHISKLMYIYIYGNS